MKDFGQYFKPGFINIIKLESLMDEQNEIIKYAKQYDVESVNFLHIFFCSIQIGLELVVMEFIREYPNLIEARDFESSTPLIIAADHGHIILVNKLIDHGANKDAVNKYKQNAIHGLLGDESYANFDIKHLNFVVKKLLSHQNVNQQDEDGNPPIFSAIIRKNTVIVKEHLKYNTNFECKNDEGMRAYEFALSVLQNNVTKINEVISHAYSKDAAAENFEIISMNTSDNNLDIENAIYKPAETILLGWIEDSEY